jgi:amidase
VPMAPHLDAIDGLSVNGVLTRSVRDSALFYDAIAEGPPDPGAPEVPRSSFLDAIGVGPGGSSTSQDPAPPALRIAVASALPPSPLTRLAPDNRAALEETVVLLRRLGHEVSEVEVDHGPLVPAPEFTALFLHGMHEEAGALAHPERLERRMRTIARVGGLLSPRAVAWARARESAYAARVNGPLADHDVLLTPVTPAPPPRIGACEGRGWLWTTVVAAATVPYVAGWNLTGQPACSVPGGFAADGRPRAVQLVGRPNDEATLLALAALLETERPWAQSRPSGFS